MAGAAISNLKSPIGACGPIVAISLEDQRIGPAASDSNSIGHAAYLVRRASCDVRAIIELPTVVGSPYPERAIGFHRHTVLIATRNAHHIGQAAYVHRRQAVR